MLPERKLIYWDARPIELILGMVKLGMAFVLLFINDRMFSFSTQNPALGDLDAFRGWPYVFLLLGWLKVGTLICIVRHMDWHFLHTLRRLSSMISVAFWSFMAYLSIRFDPVGTMMEVITVVFTLAAGLAFIQIRNERELASWNS